MRLSGYGIGTELGIYHGNMEFDEIWEQVL